MENSSRQQVKKATLFILVWCLFSLVQVAFTEIIFDEAYYKLFADHLSWGYFDHPPAIAFLIWMGTRFVGGSLGIRLCSVLLLPLTLWIFWKSFPHDKRRVDPLFFLLISAAVPYVQIVGFVATPDTPLLFAYALALYACQAFIKKEGVGEVLLLALAMALAMYSKYHAVLFLLLLICANPRLLLRPKFYIAGVLALILYLPHLWWEYQNDWVTIRYHLFDRSRAFSWHNVIEYLWNIPVSYNPLIAIPFVYYWIHKRRTDLYSRILTIIALGFWIFFLFSTFRGHTQPQWVLPLSLCMVWVLYSAGGEDPRAKMLITKLSIISVLIMAVARILLMCHLGITTPFGFSQNRNSYTQLAAITQGAPLVFDSNYGMAAHYAYYSGMPTHSQGSIYHRNSQFSIFQFDTDFYGKEVWVHCPDSLPQMKLPNRKVVSLKKIDFFIPVTKIKIKPMEPIVSAPAGDSITLTIIIENPYTFPFPLANEAGTHLHAVWKTNKGVEMDIQLSNIPETIPPLCSILRTVTIKTPEKPGSYRFGLCVARPPLKYGFGVPATKVNVLM